MYPPLESVQASMKLVFAPMSPAEQEKAADIFDTVSDMFMGQEGAKIKLTLA